MRKGTNIFTACVTHILDLLNNGALPQTPDHFLACPRNRIQKKVVTTRFRGTPGLFFHGLLQDCGDLKALEEFLVMKEDGAKDIYTTRENK